MGGEPVVSLAGVTKQFAKGGVTALQGIDLDETCACQPGHDRFPFAMGVGFGES